MKKVFLALAAVAMVAAMTSCKKTCDCNIYLGSGEPENYEYDLQYLQDTYNAQYGLDIQKCSDLNEIVEVEGERLGVECK